MKHFSFCLFFLLLCSCATVISKNKSAQSSLYGTYFLIKEAIKVSIYSYFCDEKATRKAIVLCNQCDYTMTSGYLWGHCASSGDEQILQKLMPLIYKGPTEELTAFLLTTYEQLQIACPACNEYQGWHNPMTN